MRITAEDPDSADASALLTELSAALAAITGDSGQSSFNNDDVRGERAIFLLARADNGSPLACGALRPLEFDTGELKRMFARPGMGATMLAALEAQARTLGYCSIALSTRRINERAIAFYAKHGYTEIPAYGHYATRPQSICMGKRL